MSDSEEQESEVGTDSNESSSNSEAQSVMQPLSKGTDVISKSEMV